jgi:hypothetical protein
MGRAGRRGETCRVFFIQSVCSLTSFETIEVSSMVRIRQSYYKAYLAASGTPKKNRDHADTRNS